MTDTIAVGPRQNLINTFVISGSRSDPRCRTSFSDAPLFSQHEQFFHILTVVVSIYCERMPASGAVAVGSEFVLTNAWIGRQSEGSPTALGKEGLA